MGFELEFIKLLQNGRTTFGDYMFYLFTQMGTELFFMIAVMVVYWCLDKREGFKLVNLFMLSQVCVGLIKITVRRTRPYFHEGIDAVIERTDGYSFPSGHSNNIAVVGVHASLMCKKKYPNAFLFVAASSVLLVLLVMLSRMYLGQHYLTDVVTGAAIGVAVGLVGYKIFDLFGNKEEKLLFAIIPCCVLILAVVIAAYIKGKESDSLVSIAGTFSAVGLGYFLEKKHVRYEVKADKFYKYVLRLLLGAAIALGLKTGLKALFALFAKGIWELLITGFVRYFLIGIWVSLFAPMAFKKLRI